MSRYRNVSKAVSNISYIGADLFQIACVCGARHEKLNEDRPIGGEDVAI